MNVCRWSAVATVSATLLVLRAEPLAAAFPGANGAIAFASDRDGNYEIYVMKPDASAQTRLTQEAAVDVQPAWSPDGKAIAFMSERDGNAEIYAMSADGGGPRRLTTEPSADANPRWSPDGKQLVFTSARDGDDEIYLMNVDGGNQTRLTSAAGLDRNPAWSPDGRRIAFTSGRDGDAEIYVMNADGAGQARLTRSPASEVSPSWSPDGRYVAFASDRDGNYELYVMNAGGGDQRRLTRNLAADLDPAWSPDGKQIAFTSRRDGSTEVYTMNADGSAQTRLTTNEAEDTTADWQTLAIPPSVVTTASFRTRWRESVVRGSLDLDGRVAAPVTVALDLKQSGRTRLSARLDLPAGSFTRRLTLPGTLLPGDYVLGVTPEAAQETFSAQSIPLDLPPPREGVVRDAYTSTSPGGIPLTRFPPRTTVVFAHFRFAARPRPGLALTVSWYRPGGRLAGPSRRKPPTSLVVSYVGGRNGAPLPRGTWLSVIRAGPIVVRRLAFRIG